MTVMSHADVGTVMIISSCILLRMRNVSEKFVEKIEKLVLS